MDVPVCEVRALLLSTTTHLPALRSLQLYAQVQHGVTMHVHPCKNRPCATSQAEQWGAASNKTEGGSGRKSASSHNQDRILHQGRLHHIHPGTCTALGPQCFPTGT